MEKENLSHSQNTKLTKNYEQVSVPAFSFLFSALVQYFYSRSPTTVGEDIEDKLFEVGSQLGRRFNELAALRELGQHSRLCGNVSKERNTLAAIQYVYNSCWKVIFGRQADKVDKAHSTGGEIQYMITENEPLPNRHIPGEFNCASFVSGIIFGILSGVGFKCSVKHFNRPTDEFPGKTVYLVEFLTK